MLLNILISIAVDNSEEDEESVDNFYACVDQWFNTK